MQQAVLIAAGGALGALARFGMSTVIQQGAPGTFPRGTLVVNLTGSFLIGLLMEAFDAAVIPPEWRSFLTIGFLGAYTTFSTYTFETVQMLRDGELGPAALNVIGANAAGLGAVVLGMYVTRIVIKLST
jgi:CrcB protein